MFEKAGLLTKEGNRLQYVTTDGEVIKYFRKGWESNEDGCLDKVMAEYSSTKISNKITEEVEE